MENTARVETSVAAVEASAAAVEKPAGAVETSAPRRTAAVACTDSSELDLNDWVFYKVTFLTSQFWLNTSLQSFQPWLLSIRPL